MAETFSFNNELVTWLDYARWRLDDIDVDDVLVYNETYLSLYTKFGPVEGLALVASSIAVVMSKRVTAFGEAAGIRFSKRNLDYFQNLPDIIRNETPFIPGVSSANLTRLIRVGAIINPIPISAREARSRRIAMAQPECLN